MSSRQGLLKEACVARSSYNENIRHPWNEGNGELPLNITLLWQTAANNSSLDSQKSVTTLRDMPGKALRYMDGKVHRAVLMSLRQEGEINATSSFFLALAIFVYHCPGIMKALRLNWKSDKIGTNYRRLIKLTRTQKERTIWFYLCPGVFISWAYLLRYGGKRILWNWSFEKMDQV